MSTSMTCKTIFTLNGRSITVDDNVCEHHSFIDKLFDEQFSHQQQIKL